MVTVKPGYALNYLLPNGLAAVASDHHKRMVEKHRAQLEQIEKARLAGLRTQADELGRQSVTIEANANDEGHLYGSVGAADIVRHVEEQTGAVIDRHDLVLDEPIKTVGEHNVRVELIGGVVFELTVDVVAEA